MAKKSLTPVMQRRNSSEPSERACAKVNLVLAVVGWRSDGFHEIRSLAVGVGLADTIRFSEAEPDVVTLRCDRSDVPVDEANLAVRAARLLANRAGVKKGVHIELSKAIPPGAGLGGGSSNAATTLSVLNRMWGAGLTEAELAALGAELGSDVPLFFRLPAVEVRGRGEITKRIELAWSGWMVLLFGGMEVSSREVYAVWNEADSSRPRWETAVKTLMGATTAVDIRGVLFNDLEPAVFRVCPAVERLLGRVHDLGGPHARISGAGSTVYTIHDDEREARAFADTLRRKALGNGVAVVRAPGNECTAT